MKQQATLYILLSFLVLGGCASQTQQSKLRSNELQQEEQAHLSDALVLEAEQENQVSYRDFPPDSLYALMLAEIALERQMPDLALSYYRREAHKTRDSGVIKRSLEISTWLEAHQISLELIALWQEVEPENAAAHAIMARQQLYFGLVQGSLASIERVLALGAQFNFDYFNQVLPRLEESERLTVLRELEGLYQKFPKNSQLSLSLSHLYGLLDQRQSALDAAERAKKLDKHDDRPVIMHSELRFNYGYEREAIKEMEKGLKKFPESRALQLLYVQSLLKLGKTAKAKEQIQNSVAAAPGEHEFRHQLALVSGEYRLNEVAKDLFKQNIESAFRREESYFYLSRIAETEGQYEESIAYLENIRPGPGFIEARLQIAYILNEQNKLDQALHSLELAQAQQKDNEGAFFHAQADFLSMANRKAEAITKYSEGITVYPEIMKLRYAKAMLAESMNRIDIVESELLYIIEREPRNAMALNALGYTLANKTTRYKEALQYIELAYEISPDDAAIIDSMGWVYYQLGDNDKAIKYLRKAIAIQADHEIAAHLGEVLWVSGYKAEAKRVWDEALDKNQDSEVLRAVMNRFTQEAEEQVLTD